MTDRFLQLSHRQIETGQGSLSYRNEYSAYATFLGIVMVVRERDGWVWRLSSAASQLLCGDEPNVRAFVRVQLSLLQYPFLVGMVYHDRSASIQANALAQIQRMINAEVRVVPLRLILRSLKVKSEMTKSSLEQTLLTYREILFLFNNSLTSTVSNPSEDKIEKVLELAFISPNFVSEDVFKEFYRNFHYFERTGLIKRFDDGLMIDLTSDVESFSSKEKMVSAITGMTSFFEEFYNFGSLSAKEHLYQMASNSTWSRYYDGIKLPQDIYSCLVGGLQNNETESIQVGVEEVEQPSIMSSIVDLPPLTLRQPSRSSSQDYNLPNSVANPELTRLKRQKSNTYHRFLVYKIEERLRGKGCQPKDNVYIDLAGEIDGLSILFEMKSCNRGNVVSQIRKAVSQVYEYRYRYSYEFPQGSTVLCIVIQERPERWWIDYLIQDRDINVIWLDGVENLACTSNCDEVVKQLVDTVEE